MKLSVCLLAIGLAAFGTFFIMGRNQYDDTVLNEITQLDGLPQESHEYMEYNMKPNVYSYRGESPSNCVKKKQIIEAVDCEENKGEKWEYDAEEESDWEKLDNPMAEDEESERTNEFWESTLVTGGFIISFVLLGISKILRQKTIEEVVSSTLVINKDRNLKTETVQSVVCILEPPTPNTLPLRMDCNICSSKIQPGKEAHFQYSCTSGSFYTHYGCLVELYRGKNSKSTNWKNWKDCIKSDCESKKIQISLIRKDMSIITSQKSASKYEGKLKNERNDYPIIRKKDRKKVKEEKSKNVDFAEHFVPLKTFPRQAEAHNTSNLLPVSFPRRTLSSQHENDIPTSMKLSIEVKTRPLVKCIDRVEEKYRVTDLVNNIRHRGKKKKTLIQIPFGAPYFVPRSSLFSPNGSNVYKPYLPDSSSNEFSCSNSEQLDDSTTVCEICPDEIEPMDTCDSCPRCVRQFHRECATHWTKYNGTCSHCQPIFRSPQDYPSFL